MGVNKTLYQGRQSVFWPGLTKDINEKILACPACMKYAAKNCAKPLINNLATSKPWQALSIDNFQVESPQIPYNTSWDRIDTATTIAYQIK